MRRLSRAGRHHGRVPRGRALLPVLAVTAGLVTGCDATATPAGPIVSGGPIGSAGPAGSAGPVSQAERMRRQPPIYEAIYHRGDAKYLVDRAKTKLITPCMAQRGLTYRMPERADSAEDQAMLRPFGVESATERPAPAPENPEAPQTDGKAYSLALYGPADQRVQARGDRISVTAPAAGCEADAERRLLGDRRVRQMELRILLFEAESRALEAFDADRSFDPVRTAWRDCMRGAGFGAVTDPATLLNTLPAGTQLATDRSVAADLACKGSTGYLPQAYTRMAEAQRRELAAKPGLLDEYDTIQRVQLAAAREVLD